MVGLVCWRILVFCWLVVLLVLVVGGWLWIYCVWFCLGVCYGILGRVVCWCIWIVFCVLLVIWFFCSGVWGWEWCFWSDVCVGCGYWFWWSRWRWLFCCCCCIVWFVVFCLVVSFRLCWCWIGSVWLVRWLVGSSRYCGGFSCVLCWWLVIVWGVLLCVKDWRIWLCLGYCSWGRCLLVCWMRIGVVLVLVVSNCRLGRSIWRRIGLVWILCCLGFVLRLCCCLVLVWFWSFWLGVVWCFCVGGSGWLLFWWCVFDVVLVVVLYWFYVVCCLCVCVWNFVYVVGWIFVYVCFCGCGWLGLVVCSVVLGLGLVFGWLFGWLFVFLGDSCGLGSVGCWCGCIVGVGSCRFWWLCWLLSVGCVRLIFVWLRLLGIGFWCGLGLVFLLCLGIGVYRLIVIWCSGVGFLYRWCWMLVRICLSWIGWWLWLVCCGVGWGWGFLGCVFVCRGCGWNLLLWGIWLWGCWLGVGLVGNGNWLVYWGD